MGAPPSGDGRRGEIDPPLDLPEPHLTDAEEFDAPAEVAAAFRTQRRIALGYFLVFALVMFALPALTVSLDWWTSARVVGGMSPSFLMAAVGLYAFFLGLGAGVATLADNVERRMLGPGPTDGRGGRP